MRDWLCSRELEVRFVDEFLSLLLHVLVALVSGPSVTVSLLLVGGEHSFLLFVELRPSLHIVWIWLFLFWLDVLVECAIEYSTLELSSGLIRMLSLFLFNSVEQLVLSLILSQGELSWQRGDVRRECVFERLSFLLLELLWLISALYLLITGLHTVQSDRRAWKSCDLTSEVSLPTLRFANL